MKPKFFFVPVFVSWNSPAEYNSEKDYTKQSVRIMDVPGFQNFLNDPSYTHVAYVRGTVRTAVIRGTSKVQVREAVREALAEIYYPGINSVSSEREIR